MRTTTIAFLQCPFCANSIEPKPGAREDEIGIHFGITACAGCGYEFPIVGGVLIVAEPGQLIGVEAEAPAFRSGRGVGLGTLCRLIKKGDFAEAFSRLLNPATPDADLLTRVDSSRVEGRRAEASDFARPDPHRRPRIPPDVQARLNQLSGERLLRHARRRIGRHLLENQEDLTALEALDLYMARYSRAETAVHFAYSFGQPRHLAALSVASLIRERGGPILDLACGPGHLTHFFCSGDAAVGPVIGMDRNFFRLWIARHFVAPAADFVCQWVDRPLPFRAASFDSVFCSDAFHLVLNKAGCVSESRRVIGPDGLIGIVRFGNAAVEPREGHELTVDGYERLFGEVPHVLLGEDELVGAYLAGHGADLSQTAMSTSLHGQKWLSAVLSDNEATFREHEPFTSWPHAEGRLAINPIYVPNPPSAPEGVELRFEFPSEWYGFENAGYLDYAPESVRVSREALADVRAGRRTEAVQQLIDRFVVVGVPDRYLREPLLQGDSRGDED